jgi:hypothetical protein
VAVLVVTCALFALTGAAFGQNGVMMQYFHWYDSPSDNLRQKVAAEAPNLHDAGFTALWLPPAYKVTWPSRDRRLGRGGAQGGEPERRLVVRRLSCSTASGT